MEEKILFAIKKVLIDNGYEQTTLVKEHFKDNEDPLEISKIFLQNSDVNFLIFTRNGKKYGLITELSLIAESDEMSQRILQCVVFDELDDENSSSVPLLSKSQIKNNRIPYRCFRNKEELGELVIDESFLQLRNQRRLLRDRCGVQSKI